MSLGAINHRLNLRPGQKLWWDGTTLILGLDAGCLVSMYTRSRYVSILWRWTPSFKHLSQTFEMMNNRAVAVVVDPIQSVKGKVVIDAFRTIPTSTVVMGVEPRQTTSNIGHIKKPSIQALIHGLNRHYYSIAVNYRKTEIEQTMLMNLHKQNWTQSLKLRDFHSHKTTNETAIKVRLAS
jgi:hypothetical protein